MGNTELADNVGRVSADLAGVLAAAHAIGEQPPPGVFALLLELEVWSRKLRGEPAGATAALARLVRDGGAGDSVLAVGDGVLVTRPHDWSR